MASKKYFLQTCYPASLSINGDTKLWQLLSMYSDNIYS